MTIDDISHWTMLRGVGHIVVSASGGWVTAACGRWMTGSTTTVRPARICRACREALPRLRRAGEKESP